MRRILTYMLLLLCLQSPTWAAQKYLRAGQTTADSTGAGWANAYNSVIKAKSQLVRGDTLWVADGSYSQVTWDTAASGTETIWVIKATVARHGSDDDWDNEYGDGQAIIAGPGSNTGGPFTVKSDHWVFDGQVGAGFGETPYGFKVALSDTADNATVVQIYTNVDHVTLRHFEIDGTDEGEAGVYKPRCDGVFFRSGTADILIKNCYIHDVVRCHFQMTSACETIIENCYIEKTVGGNKKEGDYIHHEAIAIYGGALTANNHIRNNFFRNVTAVGYIVFTNATASGYHIYGNCFWQSDEDYNLENYYVGTDSYSTIDSLFVYHNTFANINSGVAACRVFVAGDSVCYRNNLFYNCNPDGYFGRDEDTGTLYHDYNASDVDLGEAHSVVVSGNPFVDAANGDFNPVAGAEIIGAGADLGPVYTPDSNSTERAQTIGAIELDAGHSSGAILWYHPNIGDDANNGNDSAHPVKTISRLSELASDGDQVRYAGIATEAFVVPGNLVTATTWPDSQFILDGRAPVSGFIPEIAGGESVSDSSFTDGNASYNDSTHATAATTAYGDVGRRTTAVETSQIGLHFPVTTSNFFSWTSATLRLFCTTSKTGTVRTVVKVCEHAAIAANDSGAFQEAIAAAIANGDSLTFDIVNPTAGTVYSFDITALMDNIVVDGINDVFVLVQDNGTGSNSLYLRVAFIADAVNPEALLVFTYTQTGGTATLAYKTGMNGATHAWQNGIAGKPVVFAALDAGGEYCLSGDTLYVSLADTSGWAANTITDAVDYNEKYGVTLSRIISREVRRFARMDGSWNRLLNCFISGKTGVYALGDSLEMINCAWQCSDSLVCATGAELSWTHSAYDSEYTAPDSLGENDHVLTPLYTGDYLAVEGLRDRGLYVGMPYQGDAPDIWPVELDAIEEPAAEEAATITKRKSGMRGWFNWTLKKPQ